MVQYSTKYGTRGLRMSLQKKKKKTKNIYTYIYLFIYILNKDYLNIKQSKTLRVRLVGGVKKWEDRKWKEDRKVKGQKRFSFLFVCVWLGEQKGGGMENSFVWLRRKVRGQEIKFV